MLRESTTAGRFCRRRKSSRCTFTGLQTENGNGDQAGQSSVLYVPASPQVMTARMLYQGLGNFPKSLEVCKRAIEINPDWAPGPVNLAWTYLALERYEDAGKTVAQALERKVVVPDLLILPY